MRRNIKFSQDFCLVSSHHAPIREPKVWDFCVEQTAVMTARVVSIEIPELVCRTGLQDEMLGATMTGMPLVRRCYGDTERGGRAPRIIKISCNTVVSFAGRGVM